MENKIKKCEEITLTSLNDKLDELKERCNTLAYLSKEFESVYLELIFNKTQNFSIHCKLSLWKKDLDELLKKQTEKHHELTSQMIALQAQKSDCQSRIKAIDKLPIKIIGGVEYRTLNPYSSGELIFIKSEKDKINVIQKEAASSLFAVDYLESISTKFLNLERLTSYTNLNEYWILFCFDTRINDYKLLVENLETEIEKGVIELQNIKGSIKEDFDTFVQKKIQTLEIQKKQKISEIADTEGQKEKCKKRCDLLNTTISKLKREIELLE